MSGAKKKRIILPKRLENAAGWFRITQHYLAPIAGDKEKAAADKVADILNDAMSHYKNGNRQASISALLKAEEMLGIPDGVRPA